MAASAGSRPAGDPSSCGPCGSLHAPYTCPRCHVRICSVPCYRGHGPCAQDFERREFQLRLRGLRGDEASRRRLTEALGRLRELREAGDSEDLLGLGPEWAEEERLWEQLGPEQRRGFQALLESGEISALLPPWEPWWDEAGGPGAALVEELGDQEPPKPRQEGLGDSDPPRGRQQRPQEPPKGAQDGFEHLSNSVPIRGQLQHPGKAPTGAQDGPEHLSISEPTKGRQRQHPGKAPVGLRNSIEHLLNSVPVQEWQQHSPETALGAQNGVEHLSNSVALQGQQHPQKPPRGAQNIPEHLSNSVPIQEWQKHPRKPPTGTQDSPEHLSNSVPTKGQQQYLQDDPTGSQNGLGHLSNSVPIRGQQQQHPKEPPTCPQDTPEHPSNSAPAKCHRQHPPESPPGAQGSLERLLNSVPARIPALASLSASPASPLVAFQLPNVLFAYAYALSLHNGDVGGLLPEFCGTVLDVSGALGARRVYRSASEALQDTLRAVEAGRYPECPLGAAGVMRAVGRLLAGEKGRYALAALSHLSRLLGRGRKGVPAPDRGRLFGARKKCDFLLSWANEHRAELAPLALAVEVERQAHMAAIREVSTVAQELEKMWGGKVPPSKKPLIEELD